MKLLLDEGLPLRAAARLRELGVEASHVLEVGDRGVSDEEILVRAVGAQACVVTLDSDFHRILALSAATAPSVVRIRIEGLNWLELANLLQRIVASAREELERGAVVSVTETQVRVRKLPLSK